MAVAGLIPAAASLLGGVFGLFQGGRARRLERNNPFPTAAVNQNLLTNTLIAQQMAQTGIPQQQYELQRDNILTSNAGALRAATTSGRPVSVMGIQRQTNQAFRQLGADDAAARVNNQVLAMQQRSALANEENRVWYWNRAQRYLTTAQQVAQLRNASNQNIFGAIGNIAQIGVMGGFNGLFGGSGATTTPQAGTGFAGAVSAPQTQNLLGNGFANGFGMAPVLGRRS